MLPAHSRWSPGPFLCADFMLSRGRGKPCVSWEDLCILSKARGVGSECWPCGGLGWGGASTRSQELVLSLGCCEVGCPRPWEIPARPRPLPPALPHSGAPLLLDTFQKPEEEAALPDGPSEADITLVPKPGTILKGNKQTDTLHEHRFENSQLA